MGMVQRIPLFVALVPVLALLITAPAGTAFAAGVRQLAFVNSQEEGFQVYDAVSMRPVAVIPSGPDIAWGTSAVDPEGKHIFLYGGGAGAPMIIEVDPALGRVVRTIPNIGGYGGPMAYDSKRKRLYIASVDRGLAVIDTDLGLFMGAPAVPRCEGVAVLPSGKKVYALSNDPSGPKSVEVIRASDLAITRHIPTRGDALAIGFKPDGRKVYVTVEDALLVIDTLTDRVIKRIAVPGNCRNIAVHPSGRWIYLTNGRGQEDGKLIVVNALSNKVAKIVAVGKQPGPVAVSPDGTRLMVMDTVSRYTYKGGHGGITWIDTATLAAVGRTGGFGDGEIATATVTPVSHAFTVNSTADAVDSKPGDGLCETASGNGVCTLRAAVEETNDLPGMDVINVPAGTYALSIPGMDEDETATGDLDVRDILTLRGAGMATTVVDGGALDRVFHVQADGNLHLKNLKVTNGLAPWRDNRTYVNYGGAAIYHGGGVLDLFQVEISGNTGEGFGGIVDSNPSMSPRFFTDGCTIKDNVNRAVNTVWYRDIVGPGEWFEEQVLMEGPALLSTQYTNIVRSLVQGNTGSGVIAYTQGDVTESVISGNSSYFAAGGLVVERGYVTRTLIADNAGAWGGGVSINNGAIKDSVVSGNTAQAPPASPYQAPPPASQLAGGGIYAKPDWGLDVLRCTVSGNTAPRGGGILVEDASYLNLVNSTVSGNSATGDGGGVCIDWDWNFSLTNCTIAGNIADSDGDGSGDGGGIFRGSTDIAGSQGVWLANTLIAGNHDAGGEVPDCDGGYHNGLFNLIGDGTGCTFVASVYDIVGTSESTVDPLLGPLADNGGPTPTQALLPGSPAINAGNFYVFPQTDQRGVKRPRGGRSDIGAFERQQ